MKGNEGLPLSCITSEGIHKRGSDSEGFSNPASDSGGKPYWSDDDLAENEERQTGAPVPRGLTQPHAEDHTGEITAE